MSTNLEQAINCVLNHQHPINIQTVLMVYLQVIGYVVPDGATSVNVPSEGLFAFQKALEKAPFIEPSNSMTCSLVFGRRVHTVEITNLRRQYWEERLLKDDAVHCTCSPCRAIVAYCHEVLRDIEAACKSPPKKRVKNSRPRLKRRRLAKRRRDVADVATPFDPYAPSTSAVLL